MSAWEAAQAIPNDGVSSLMPLCHLLVSKTRNNTWNLPSEQNGTR